MMLDRATSAAYPRHGLIRPETIGPIMNSVSGDIGASVFEAMSRLARDHGAVNLFNCYDYVNHMRITRARPRAIQAPWRAR
jgi:hypothetical protein